MRIVKLMRLGLALAIPLAVLLGVAVACETKAPGEPGQEQVTDGGDKTPDTSKADTSKTDTVSPDQGKGDTDPKSCIPSKAVWDRLTKKLVTEHCGKCHGDKPNFGAPYSLLNYEDLISGTIGKRKVDRMVVRMANKTMPPSGSPLPKHADLDTMTEWASCGFTHPDHSIGLQSSRDIFKAPAKPDAGWQTFDVVAPKFGVGEKVLDLYQCFVIEAPVDQDRFIRRIETVIDESRVLHHIVLLLDKENVYKGKDPFTCKGLPANADYLYAWAPGANAIQFPDGGLRLKKGQRFILQIHYNNGAGVKDAIDSSGVRIHHSAPEGTEYGMLSPGPVSFQIPAGETKKVTGHCQVDEDMKIIAGMPHMHETGAEFFQEIVRKDGKKEEMIKLTGWSFESQFFYDTPHELKAGDILTTTCTFTNKTGSTVRSGSNTKDEMCFNFMYVSPPPKSRFCDGAKDPNDPDVPYKAGACAPKDSKVEPPKVDGKFKIGAPTATKGGTVPTGTWLLKQLTIYSATAETPIGKIDIDSSGMLAKGQLITGDKVVLDVNAKFNLRLAGGLGVSRDVPTSLSGAFAMDPKEPGKGILTPDCGAKDPATFEFEVTGDTFRLISTSNVSGVLVLKTEFVFQKQP